LWVALKLTNETAAAIGRNYRRILDQILSRERICARYRTICVVFLRTRKAKISASIRPDALEAVF
jgi:hypothetical protein